MTQLLHSLLSQVGLPIPPTLVNAELASISCDSRRISAGTLFLGLPGTKVDGGQFWRQVLADGAAAAIISQAAAQADPPDPQDSVVVVPDPVALWVGELAAAYWNHPSQRLRLIGVTGTNGKTTTTHLIEHLAAQTGHPAALFGTLVNRWPGHSVTAQHTTAFADLLQGQLAQAVESGTLLAAMEVSSHALDQHRVAGCRFAGAVFTNLTQDHLDYHPSMEAYFEAKSLLFSSPLLQGGAVVNVDDPWGARLAERLRGEGKPCWRSSLARDDMELAVQELQMASDG
ncbi:MAG: Mur ligase family protein, partial [Cyanobium sp.]